MNNNETNEGIDKDFNLTIGIRIREIRESKDLSREKFSELCGISTSFLAAVESGKKSITSKTIYKICHYAHISADYLLFGNQNSFEEDTAIEILRNLTPSQRQHAYHILFEFSNAIHEIPDNQS